MTITTKLIPFIILLFTSCKIIQKERVQDNECTIDEIEIVNLVFYQVVEPDSVWRKEAKSWNEYKIYNSYEIDSIKFDSLKVANEIVESNKKFDSISIYVYLYDSLIGFSRNEINMSMLTNENFQYNFSVDSNYRNLIYKLTDSTKSVKFNSANMIRKYRYIVESFLNWNSDEEIITYNAGHIKLSRAVFNSDRTKACIYAELIKGELNGFGGLLFLEKNNKKWRIISQRQLWVS